MKIGRNEPCPCGSGKKYKKCCLKKNEEVSVDLKFLNKFLEEAKNKIKKLTDRGILINYVKPILFKGKKVFAIGNQLFYQQPANQTLHEFIIEFMVRTLGVVWYEDERKRSDRNKHYIIKCIEEYFRWKTSNAISENEIQAGIYGVFPNGYVQYLLSLAFDLATLFHTTNLPEQLLTRLKNKKLFQGARYEIAIAAIFTRLDYTVKFYDDKYIGEKHPDFLVTHKLTNAEIDVEVKSKHRTGVLHIKGEPNQNEDAKLESIISQALSKNTGERPYLAFIDVNYPPSRGVSLDNKEWFKEVKRHISERLPATIEQPDKHSGIVFTNYCYQYEEENDALGDGYLVTIPLFSTKPIRIPHFLDDLTKALDNYSFVPSEQDL